MRAVDKRAAAEVLWLLWQKGDVIQGLPHELKPNTRAEGYAIQAEFDRLAGTTRVGWKIAATSVAGQKHIGVDGPLAGRIFEARLHEPGSSVSIERNLMRVAEPEFAFRFGRTLSPRAERYAMDEVIGAVATLHLAIELPDSRFAEFARVGGPSLIADNACAHELVLGEPVQADWRAINVAMHRVHATVGNRYERDGVGSNVLGDPRIALTWIVNELSALGIPMAKGEFVTTGTCTVPLDIFPGDHVRADFGALGRIDVRIG